MKIYFDSCCYGRPYDDTTDDIRASMEAAAIMKITTLARTFGYVVCGSMAIEDEINANDDAEKRADAIGLYNRTVTVRADHNDNVLRRYAPLARAAGVRGMDIFHLCYAIAAGVDYLITTDKKFLKATAKLNLSIKVINPLNFNIGGAI